MSTSAVIPRGTDGDRASGCEAADATEESAGQAEGCRASGRGDDRGGSRRQAQELLRILHRVLHRLVPGLRRVRWLPDVQAVVQSPVSRVLWRRAGEVATVRRLLGRIAWPTWCLVSAAACAYLIVAAARGSL